MRTPTMLLRQPIAIFLGTLIVLLGAGMAGARVQGGPPWAQTDACDTGGVDAAATERCDPDATGDGGAVADEPLEDPEQAKADVEAFFGDFGNGCGAAFLGEADLADEDTLVAFDDLVGRLDAGQTSHGVQGFRSVMRNCEEHPNGGLQNALYRHGLNWIRHHEHELWLQEEFADKWPDGKPGNGGAGNPHAGSANADAGSGNPHGGTPHGGNPHATSSAGAPGNGNGNAFGHGT